MGSSIMRASSSMKSEMYIPVSQQENDEEQSSQLLSKPRTTGWKYIATILSIALIISLSFNTYWIYQRHFKPWDLTLDLPTRYGMYLQIHPSPTNHTSYLRPSAHLTQNIPTEITRHADYDSLNRTIQDAAWNDPYVEPWNAFIALDEDYAMSLDLPHSQRWPWDESKGVYIPTGAHELHCVVCTISLDCFPRRQSNHTLSKRILRTHINEIHDSMPENSQTWKYDHLLHCLNILRESVMCHADDTPLYVGRLHANTLSPETPKAGIGSVKMCRDWNAMMDWARERSACYRPVHWGEKGFPEMERYKFCPDGRKPWEDMARS